MLKMRLYVFKKSKTNNKPKQYPKLLKRKCHNPMYRLIIPTNCFINFVLICPLDLANPSSHTAAFSQLLVQQFFYDGESVCDTVRHGENYCIWFKSLLKLLHHKVWCFMGWH